MKPNFKDFPEENKKDFQGFSRMFLVHVLVWKQLEGIFLYS